MRLDGGMFVLGRIARPVRAKFLEYRQKKAARRAHGLPRLRTLGRPVKPGGPHGVLLRVGVHFGSKLIIAYPKILSTPHAPVRARNITYEKP